MTRLTRDVNKTFYYKTKTKTLHLKTFTRCQII